MLTIPAEKINSVEIKSRPGNAILGGLLITVLGFGVTAGLTNHGGDVDGVGKTIFFELLLAAIEGSTSSDSRRRRTALIAGGVGGTAVLFISLFTKKKFSLVFPLKNRQVFFNEKKAGIDSFIIF